MNKDISCVFIYFSPQNYSFHNMRNCDMFSESEKEVANYLILGNNFVTDDFNSRT